MTITASTKPGTIINTYSNEIDDSVISFCKIVFVGWQLVTESYNSATKKIHTSRTLVHKSKIGTIREFLSHESYQDVSLVAILPITAEKYS